MSGNTLIHGCFRFRTLPVIIRALVFCPLYIQVFGALLPGCCRCLSYLDLSHNVFSHRRTKDLGVPPAWKEFFASAQALKVVNLSDTKLTPEALK